LNLQKIISGGQTGADQGALEAARELGIQTGGWASRGYKTENGPAVGILQRFGLKEHSSSYYPDRTDMNVRMSDATVWFGKFNTAGYRCTKKAACKHNKPFIENPTEEHLIPFLEKYNVATLNVAGNRESNNPGIQKYVKDFLIAILKHDRKILEAEKK